MIRRRVSSSNLSSQDMLIFILKTVQKVLKSFTISILRKIAIDFNELWVIFVMRLLIDLLMNVA